MTYLDHDLGPEGPSRSHRPVNTQRTPAAGQAPLLDLQRLAGNAAVSSAVKSGRFDSSVPVQRLDEDAADEEFAEEEAASEEVNAEEAEAAEQQEDMQEESEG